MIESLLTIYQGNLDYAQRIVADIEGASVCDDRGVGMNHPAWILGHLASTSDFWLTELGGQRRFSEDWDARFGPRSQPVADASHYPSKDELLDALTDAHQRMAETVNRLTPAALEADPGRFGDLKTLCTHVLVAHERTHLGQLSAWRRIQGFPRV